MFKNVIFKMLYNYKDIDYVTFRIGYTELKFLRK